MKKVLKVVFYLYVLIILFLSFYPVPETPTSDKLNHFIAFFVYSILYRIALQKSYWSNFFTAFLLGAFIEIVQYFIPYRSGEYADLVADIFGALCGMFLIFTFEFSLKILKNKEEYPKI